MDPDQINSTLACLEHHTEGAGIFVRVRLIDGSTVFGAYSFPNNIRSNNIMCIERAGDDTVGSAEHEDSPNVYVPFKSIVAIEGPMLECRES